MYLEKPAAWAIISNFLTPLYDIMNRKGHVAFFPPFFLAGLIVFRRLYLHSLSCFSILFIYGLIVSCALPVTESMQVWSEEKKYLLRFHCCFFLPSSVHL